MGSTDDISFVVGSENRLAVLAALGDGEQSRRDLVESVGISKSTTGRILSAFEEREWIVSDAERRYRLTPAGWLVGAAVSAASEAFTALSALEPVVPWVPWEEIALDPSHLREAQVTLATDANPFAPLSRLNTLSRRACRSLTATPVIDPQSFSITLERVIEESLETTMVVERAIGELFLDHDDLPVEAALDAGLTMYLADESIPIAVSTVDDVVVLGVTDDDLAPRALVESDESNVRAWAAQYFDSHRARAQKVR